MDEEGNLIEAYIENNESNESFYENIENYNSFSDYSDISEKNQKHSINTIKKIKNDLECIPDNLFNISRMFYNCSSLLYLSDLSDWNNYKIS